MQNLLSDTGGRLSGRPNNSKRYIIKGKRKKFCEIP